MNGGGIVGEALRDIHRRVQFEFASAVEDRLSDLLISGVERGAISIVEFSGGPGVRKQIRVNGVPDSEFRFQVDGLTLRVSAHGFAKDKSE